MGLCRFDAILWGLVLFCLLASRSGLVAGEAEPEEETCSSAYHYIDALDRSILFFEGQRSGKLPSDQRVKWRGDSALSDGDPDKVKLVGGYYDAGDNVKFGWPMAFTVSLLSWAAVEYPKQVAWARQLGHLECAIRWGADFILAAHTSPTTLYTQVGEGNADHRCWGRPEDMDTPRTLYKITSSQPGSEAAADAAAALAAASIVFKGPDSHYSATLLSHSKQLFQFADQHRGSYTLSCPFYCSFSGYQDELLWAAAWLYKATGDGEYLSYVQNNQGWSHGVPEFSWDNKLAGAQTLLAQAFHGGKTDLNKFKTDVESFICGLMPGSSSLQIKTTPGGLLYIRDSSNLQYVTSASLVLFVYAKTLTSAHVDGVTCGSVHFSVSQIRNLAKSQVEYILGNNPKKMSYMVGFGSTYPKKLHHRGSSMPSIKAHPAKIGCDEGHNGYFNSGDPNPNDHVGAIVGGPDSNDQFKDERSDYSHSEPTTYMNAAFVGCVAALIDETHDVCIRKFHHLNDTETPVEYEL